MSRISSVIATAMTASLKASSRPVVTMTRHSPRTPPALPERLTLLPCDGLDRPAAEPRLGLRARRPSARVRVLVPPLHEQPLRLRADAEPAQRPPAQQLVPV